ncbi:hypothetical protein ACFOWM_07685 [Ferruginibacter yonginensis]|uniref:Uncharacterized protein n=1 Tax=Ferruginibacter yonginensis TaxID=1310416 RepID=A0ABV8QR61_9BACT
MKNTKRTHRFLSAFKKAIALTVKSLFTSSAHQEFYKLKNFIC